MAEDVGILDAEGRAIAHLPGEIGRLLLKVDLLLRDAEMKFNLECPDCSQQFGRPTYIVPVERAGRVEFTCPHARRIADLAV